MLEYQMQANPKSNPIKRIQISNVKRSQTKNSGKKSSNEIHGPIRMFFMIYSTYQIKLVTKNERLCVFVIVRSWGVASNVRMSAKRRETKSCSRLFPQVFFVNRFGKDFLVSVQQMVMVLFEWTGLSLSFESARATRAAAQAWQC